MRESNAYHKWDGTFQKRLTSRTYEDLLQPFLFDYVEEANKSNIKNMFPGFEFKGNSTQLITQDKRVVELNEQDRVIIEDSKSIVTSIKTTEVNNLGGHRFKERKKTYLIELEV